MQTYPIADMPTYQEKKKFFNVVPSSTGKHHFRVYTTGEKRPPKKGEWYISGAIPQAYRAPNDLDTPYHIAKLIRVKKKVV